MTVRTQVKERAEHEPLPRPTPDFYEVTNTLDAELALLKQVRAFLQGRLAPVITKWAEDAFPIELLPAVRALGIGGVGMQG